MIHLTLNPDTDGIITTLDADQVIIGNESSDFAQIKIKDPSISDVHVKIIRDNDRYLVINAANDPFTSLNGLPFGKKNLKNNDQIQMGKHTLLFEIKEAEPEITQPRPKPEPKESIDINILLDEVELLGSHQKLPETDQEENKDVPPNPPEQNSENPIDPLPVELGDSPPLHTEKKEPITVSDKPNESPPNSKINVNLTKEDKQKSKINLKMVACLLFGGILLSGIIFSGIYFRASGKNSQEEKKIAAGIADIAMAMTHAQLNHIVPNKQNWADPDFIQNNLACVLSPNLHTQAQIDTHGQFTRYPYILRVYTNPDMSRFLVLAQPAPNLLQWLVHKKTIVIDSTTMEMRKITDIKKLNRLLANPNPFDGNNGTEILRVIKEGNLMPLASLAGNINHWGFIPPKALSYIRPGAENYIYNAPRYYPFGESILRKVISLNQNDVTSQEVTTLQAEMSELSRFPDLLLYTSQGLQNAIEAQKALATFAPKSQFLIGYVKFNDKGYVSSSHLFMNDESKEIALMEPGMISTDSFLDKPFSESLKKPAIPLTGKNESHEISEEDSLKESLVDTHHPLYLRLHAIASSRSRALTPLGDEICYMVQKQSNEIIPNFDYKISDLLEGYLQADHSHRTRMVQELAQLYQEYSEMPLEEFMLFVEASNMTSFINETLKSQQDRIDNIIDSETQLEEAIAKISEAESFDVLDDCIQEAADMLNLEQFPDPTRLIVLQKKMHNTVLDKISHFLLSPQSVYANATIQNQDRTTLMRILKTSWINDHDELSFFLGEFDYLKSVNTR